jgi:lactoylglutathione lyase
MKNKYGIVGVAHVGLPTNDLQKTVEFYKSLGFEVIMQTYSGIFTDKKLLYRNF